MSKRKGQKSMQAAITVAPAALSTRPVYQVQPGVAESDDVLIKHWLQTKRKSLHTAQCYAEDVSAFMQWRAAQTGQPLAELTVPVSVVHREQRHQLELEVTVCAEPLHYLSQPQLIDYANYLAEHVCERTGKPYSVATQQRKLNAVRSLLSYGHDTGFLSFNVGARLPMPEAADRLSERILSIEEVLTMIARTKRNRDRMVLKMLYQTGARVEELCSLTWRAVNAGLDGCGLVTLFGKRNKTRTVPIKGKTFKELLDYRAELEKKGEVKLDDYVFPSQKGGRLDESQVWRIVRAAAQRAGIAQKNVSPHWLRHAHVSHALDRGAPATLVRDTAGHSSLAITSRYAHARPTDSSAYYLPD